MLPPTRYSLNASEGYIALTSVIIISLLLITVSAALSSANYFSRFNILENEYKSRSASLAESCVDFAIGKLITEPAYTGNNEQISVGSDFCKVVSVSAGSYPKYVSTQAVYQKSYTNLCVQINSSKSIIGWKELKNSADSCP